MKKILFVLILAVFLNCFFVFSLQALEKQANAEDKFDYGKEIDFEGFYDSHNVKINDPFESYNRFMFKFNDKVYRYALNPASNFYNAVTPVKVQKSIDNFFCNLSMPVRFFNNIFQMKFKNACDEFGRFVINTTAGLGGIFDPAGEVDALSKHTEDFGQTLGHYGTKPGVYIVWPFLGPSTVRDTAGFIVDTGFDPLFWAVTLDSDHGELYTGVGTLRFVHNYSYNVRKEYEDITEQAIDSYVSIRHAYMQNREKKIKE